MGNAVNFVIIWLLVRRAGGTLKLRIDDADCSRARHEYIEDIFIQLDWLGIDWDEGPSGPDDFERRFSQQLRFARYREVLNELQRLEHAYPCTCSRKKIRQFAPSGIYPGRCRHNKTAPARDYAVRVKVPEDELIRLHDRSVPLAEVMGDFVLWRKDNLPAYQLCSLVDDIDDRINLVARGQDLRESTAAQLFLAECLANNDFCATAFLHHPLILDNQGSKLSKSDNALSLRAMRDNGVQVSEILRPAVQLLGIDPGPVKDIQELLAFFAFA